MKKAKKRGLPKIVSGRLLLDRRADRLAEKPRSDAELMSSRQVAEWLEVSDGWMKVSRRHDYGPRHAVVDAKTIVYVRGDVRSWLRVRAASFLERG